jgi:hypothetical protein
LIGVDKSIIKELMLYDCKNNNHRAFLWFIDEVVEKKNVLKIKFFLPCIACDDEGNFAEREFYIYEIFKIKLRYNKGIKREPLLDLGE